MGFRVRLPLDICVVASANPEDYTNRGRIITPLKDRYGAEIRTHYPKDIAVEIDIMDTERSVLLESDGYRITVPQFMKEIIAETTSLAREHADINQRSGVSVRMSIANYESLISNALRRSSSCGRMRWCRGSVISRAILPSSSGKIELETVEEGKESQLIEELIKKAVKKVFNRTSNLRSLRILCSNLGMGAALKSQIPCRRLYTTRKARAMTGLTKVIKRLNGSESPATVASALEFILEGLHLNKKLNKKVVAGRDFVLGIDSALSWLLHPSRRCRGQCNGESMRMAVPRCRAESWRPFNYYCKPHAGTLCYYAVSLKDMKVLLFYAR